MASIEQRGPNTYRIIVSAGFKGSGKRDLRKKTISLKDGLNDEQKDKLLQKEVAKFELEVQKDHCSGGNITLQKFSEEWLEKYAKTNLEASTIHNYKGELEKRILPALGHKKLNQIKPLDLLSFYNNLLEDGLRLDGKPGLLSDRTIKLQHQILSSMMNSAVTWQMIPSNPCSTVRPPRRNLSKKSTIKYLDEKKAATFIGIMETEELKYRAACYVALWGGMRRGEVLALSWDDICFADNTIDVNKSLSYVSGKGTVLKDTKNKSSNRKVTVPIGVMNVLAQLKAYQDKQKEKHGNLWQNNNLVFTTWDGSPMSLTAPLKAMKKAIDRFNKEIIDNPDLTDKEKESMQFPQISFHALRHTSATLMIHAGVNVKAVSHRLGHSMTSTTMDIYAHALKSADQQASDLLENIIKIPEAPLLKVAK